MASLNETSRVLGVVCAPGLWCFVFFLQSLYEEGKHVVFSGFTSSTMDAKVAQEFLKGKGGKRTKGTLLMMVPLPFGQSRGRAISVLSAFHKEKVHPPHARTAPAPYTSAVPAVLEIETKKQSQAFKMIPPRGGPRA